MPPGNRLITVGGIVLVRYGRRLVDGIDEVTVDQGCIVIELVTTSLRMLRKESIETPRRCEDRALEQPDRPRQLHQR